ncbi:hypothetical protein, partial [Pseudomonas aeruginosa]|uniref:hypothetical protein n=1 Tax=Pseudomonas aeruginosa TaxID=287 RepID=UPI001C12E0CF
KSKTPGRSQRAGGFYFHPLGRTRSRTYVNRRPILLKVKDWLEVKMPTSHFLNFCIEVSLLILACGAAAWLSSPVLLAILAGS